MTMHRLKSVKPVADTPYALKLAWDDGRQNVVDMSGVIYRYKVFAPLRGNPKLFRRVKIVDRGYGIAWNNELDYPAQNLRRLPDEG